MLERTQIERVRLRQIVVGPRRRTPSPDAVKQMADSLKSDGLLSPVIVRLVYDDLSVDKADSPNHIELVCGATRVEAARSLGWEEIDAQFVEGDDLDIQLAEIVENLKRWELTALERSEHVAEYARLTEERISAQLGQKIGRGRPHGGEAEASRQLGLTRQDVQRSKTIAAASPAAKAAAEEAGLADNQSALLKVAKEPTAEAQVAKVREIAAAKSKVKTPDDPRNDIEVKNAWLAAGMTWWNRGHKEWREEFLERVEGVVFDNTRVGAA